MHRVIVVGSPRPFGRSASLADELFNACIEECPEDGVSIVSVASLEVGPCCGCDACKPATVAPDKLPEDDDNLAVMPLVAASDALLHRCAIHDDMTDVRKHLDAADELIVVSPVYFASAPAQLKCLMDRLQPYYWSNLRQDMGAAKRPMVLHVVGEGGDPHGIEPLIGTVRSAFSCAGFELEMVLDWVGKIDEDGEIVAEAEEYPIPPVGGFEGLSFDGRDFEIIEVDGEFPEGFEFEADFGGAFEAAEGYEACGEFDDFGEFDESDDFDDFDGLGDPEGFEERGGSGKRGCADGSCGGEGGAEEADGINPRLDASDFEVIGGSGRANRNRVARSSSDSAAKGKPAARSASGGRAKLALFDDQTQLKGKAAAEKSASKKSAKKGGKGQAGSRSKGGASAGGRSNGKGKGKGGKRRG